MQRKQYQDQQHRDFWHGIEQEPKKVPCATQTLCNLNNMKIDIKSLAENMNKANSGFAKNLIYILIIFYSNYSDFRKF